MSSKPFRFKQFIVDQAGCAMKINTDGVILGATAGTESPKSVLDIGTGTGVIALMLAQRFPLAEIDAVEIEKQAASTASANFINSPFRERLKIYPLSFQEFSSQEPEKKYDLIVSNPPFFLDSLKNPDQQKGLARHADPLFFSDLVTFALKHLNYGGKLSLILPLETAESLIRIAATEDFVPARTSEIKSFEESVPHRVLIDFGLNNIKQNTPSFVIYSKPKEYSEQFVSALRDFFIIF